MKDIYRELAKRSIKDAAEMRGDIADEYDMLIPEKMTAQFAMTLYQHRMQEWKEKQYRAEQEQSIPDGSPGMGRQ